jgi:hypothetical protein
MERTLLISVCIFVFVGVVLSTGARAQNDRWCAYFTGRSNKLRIHELGSMP